MQSAQGASKGKGKAEDEDGDYTKHFASLRLADHGNLAPLSNSYGSSYPGSSYPDIYSSSHDQSYPTNSPYGYDAPISLAPTQSSSSAYSSTLGHVTSYATTSASVSTGGYEYQSNPYDTSNYGGYPGHPASVTSSSVPSSYGGGSVGGWSDAQTPTALSAPSAFSNRSDVDNSINRQRPPIKQYQLPCEFRNLTRCDRKFPGDDVQGWIDHVEGHVQSKFPTRLRCCK